MAAGFGRKGLAPGQGIAPTAGFGGVAAAQPAFGLGRSPLADPADEEMARRREAFLAEERARRAALGEQRFSDADAGGAGLSDVARDFTYAGGKPQRSLRKAYLLWLLLSQVSAHRFYLGATTSAICQLSLWLISMLLLRVGSGGGAMALGVVLGIAWVIWCFADLFLIPGIRRKYCA
jgi:hypothetical protein